jgi:hypothetical protein
MSIASIRNNVSSIDNIYKHNSQDQQNKKSSKSNLDSSIKITLTNEDKVIQSLEKQKQNILDQIKGIKESKIDDKSKETLINDLEKQISDLDSQINKQKSEKITQKEEIGKANEERAKNDNIEKNSAGKNLDNYKFSTMLKAYSGLSQLKTMQTVRVNLENELRTEDNVNRGDKISSKLKELKEKMQKKSKEINYTLKDASNKDGKVNNHKETKEAANDEKEVPNNKEKNKLIQFSSKNEEENDNDKSKKKVDEYA